MRNWYDVLHEAERLGFMTYDQLASCVPEGTATVRIIDAINICKKLGVTFLSNVEGLPVSQNIQEMVETQELAEHMEELDKHEDEDGLDEDPE